MTSPTIISRTTISRKGVTCTATFRTHFLILTFLECGVVALPSSSAVAAPLLQVALLIPTLKDNPEIVLASVRGGAVWRGGAVVRRGGTWRYRGGAVVRRGGAWRHRSGAVVRRGGAYVWRRPANYSWPAGGAIAAGAAIGVVSAATAAAWAGAPPARGYCWYCTDPGRRQGFWDVCR
jgi:hypothetical protein